MAYEVPAATQTKYSSRSAGTVVTDPSLLGCSGAVSTAVPPVQEWRSHGGGGGGFVVTNQFVGRPISRMQVLQVPSSLAAPKPEPHLYGDGGDEGEEECDFYLHGRKRSKLHDSLPAAAVQVRRGLFLPAYFPFFCLFDLRALGSLGSVLLSQCICLLFYICLSP